MLQPRKVRSDAKFANNLDGKKYITIGTTQINIKYGKPIP